MKLYFGRYPKDHTKERKMEIRVDPYDVWGADDTLAHIITPVLKKLKEVKHGAPNVDDIDVPDELKDDHIHKENKWDTSLYHFEKWDWVMNEMIWAFEQETIDWEDQFHIGEYDFIFEEVDETGEGEGMVTTTRLAHGPNHTHKVDTEGLKAHHKRMVAGRMLFAKYFNNLWD